MASRPLSASAQTHPVCSSINLRSADRKDWLPSAMRTRVNINDLSQVRCHSSWPRSVRVINGIGVLDAAICQARDLLNARFCPDLALLCFLFAPDRRTPKEHSVLKWTVPI